jgi:hypothetical protein
MVCQIIITKENCKMLLKYKTLYNEDDKYDSDNIKQLSAMPEIKGV